MKQYRDLGSIDGSPQSRPEPAADEEPRSLLEIALAIAGIGAWLWCALEIARTLFR